MALHRFQVRVVAYFKSSPVTFCVIDQFPEATLHHRVRSSPLGIDIMVPPGDGLWIWVGEQRVVTDNPSKWLTEYTPEVGEDKGEVLKAGWRRLTKDELALFAKGRLFWCG